MIRLKHNGAYHTIASATSTRVELDCSVWVPQPIAIVPQVAAAFICAALESA